jgi:hypothetical protein
MITTKPAAAHDFSVRAPGVSIAYCSRCAKPDLVVYQRTKCIPLPPEVAERRNAHKLGLVKKLRPIGGGPR